MFMRAAVMMHTFCLRIRSLSMDPFLITVSRVQSMRSFFNVVFRGRSALCGRVMVAGDANLDPRDKIACNISQLLIFNAVMSEFHGYALSVTNHCSHENPGVKRSPIILNPSDTSITKLPDSYVIQPWVELAQTDVFATKFNEARDGANDAVD